MGKTFLIIAPCLAMLASCVSTSVTQLDASANYAPTTPEQVRVYLSESEVPKPYKQIAVIDAKADHNTKNQAFYKKVRKEAAALGANGIYAKSAVNPTEVRQVAGALLGIPTTRSVEYIAVKTK